MIGTIGSTLKSVIVPSHYSWAANDRGGICLSYFFSLGLLLYIGFFCFMHFYAKMDIASLMTIYAPSQIEGDKIGSSLLSLSSNQYVKASVFGVLFSLGFALTAINIAIIYAIYLNIFNLALGVNFEFTQVLRIASYAMVASFIVCIGIMLGCNYFELKFIESEFNLSVMFLIIFSLYGLIGIMYARNV